MLLAPLAISLVSSLIITNSDGSQSYKVAPPGIFFIRVVKYMSSTENLGVAHQNEQQQQASKWAAVTSCRPQPPVKTPLFPSQTSVLPDSTPVDVTACIINRMLLNVRH